MMHEDCKLPDRTFDALQREVRPKQTQEQEKFMHEYDWHYQWGLEMQYQIFSSVWDRAVHVIHYTNKWNPYGQGSQPFYSSINRNENKSRSMQQNQFFEWVFMNPGVMFMYRDLIPNDEALALVELFKIAESQRGFFAAAMQQMPINQEVYKAKEWAFACMSLTISKKIQEVYDRRK